MWRSPWNTKTPKAYFSWAAFRARIDSNDSFIQRSRIFFDAVLTPSSAAAHVKHIAFAVALLFASASTFWSCCCCCCCCLYHSLFSSVVLKKEIRTLRGGFQFDQRIHVPNEAKQTIMPIRDTFGVVVSREWMELIGKTGEEAKAIVEKGNPKVRVEILPDDGALPLNVEEDRVRIYVDTEGKVTRVPVIG